MRINDLIFYLIGARDTNCPEEADVLAYAENNISQGARIRLERHFARCEEGCRDLLAFLASEPEQASAPLAEKAVFEQTGRILSYINADECKRSEHRDSAPRRRGFRVSYPKLASLASVMCAVVLGACLIFRGPSPVERGMDAINSGVELGRFTLMRAGGIKYSNFSQVRGTRGDGTETPTSDQSDADLRLRQIGNILPSAEREDAPADERRVLAKAYLTLGTLDQARHALEILTQLSSRGIETPELFNDMGMAQFRLGNYAEAIALFTKALEKSPDYNAALFNRAITEKQMDNYDAARQDWEQYINQAPDDGWKDEAKDRLAKINAAGK